MDDLITAVNTYLTQDKTQIKLPLVTKATRFVSKMMKVFGVYEEDIGPSSTQGAGSQVNLEDAIAPYVNALA